MGKKSQIRFDTSKMDANEVIFFTRQLESIEKTLYEYEEKELQYREMFPVSNRDHEGAESITYRMYGKVGMAKIIGNYADDLPRVDIYATEHTQKVKSCGASFGYSRQEIRNAMMANTPLEEYKAEACRRAIREKEHDIAFNGDSSFNLQGFLGNANIPTGAAANGAGGTPQWSTKTAAEILTDFYTGVTTIRQATKNIHSPDTVLLPIAQYDLIAMKKVSDYSDDTILEHILKKNSYGIKNVYSVVDELDLAFTGSSDGAVFYEKNSKIVEQRIPMEMKIHPAQERNLEFVFPCESRHGGVVVRYPLACYFLYDI